MKLFVKFLLFILVAAFVGQFYVKGPDGKPLLSWQKLFPGKSSPVANLINKAQSEGADLGRSNSGNSDTVYKWKDKNGVWQFSQMPPNGSNGASTEKVTYNYKQNIMDAPKKAEASEGLADEPKPKKKRQLIMASSAKAGGHGSKTTGLAGGTLSQNEKDKNQKADNPALDMLESGELGGPSLTTVPLDKLPALIDQAKSLNKVMENRTQQIDSQVNGL